MGWFGSKSSDSKARIDELKKKIQAEQAAMSNEPKAHTTQPPPPSNLTPPSQPVAAPQPAQAPPPVQAPAAAPVQQNPQPVPVQYRQQPWPVEPARVAPPQRPVFVEAPIEQPRRQQHIPDLLEDTYMEEIKTGIVLDLGDGMSLNLPIRSRMRLDEFLHIADRVRELQKVQGNHY